MDLVAFSHARGFDEPWDTRCGAAFLGGAFDLSPGGLVLEAPIQPGRPRAFRNADAAFQALKYWHYAEDFAELSGSDAQELAKRLDVRLDANFSGFGGGWQAMLVVLGAKFEPRSRLAEALLRTGDAMLLNHPAAGNDKVWSDGGDGEGGNWLGLQLLLIRDKLSGRRVWTNWIKKLFDTENGNPHSFAAALRWQDAVRKAREVLLERGPAALPAREGAAQARGTKLQASPAAGGVVKLRGKDVVPQRSPSKETEEFAVTIQRVPNVKLGIEFETVQTGMLIDAVTGGPVQDWNQANPNSQIQHGDLVFEVNGVRGTGHELVAEIKASNELRMKVLRRGREPTGKTAEGERGTVLAELALVELEKAEEIAYGEAFGRLGGGAASSGGVPIEDAALRSLLLSSIPLSEEALEAKLLKAAPELHLPLEGFLGLLREHCAPEEPAAQRFLELSDGQEHAPAQECRTHLPALVQKVLGKHDAETSAWWERCLDSVMPDADSAGNGLTLERWTSCYKRAARVVRLSRYARF